MKSMTDHPLKGDHRLGGQESDTEWSRQACLSHLDTLPYTITSVCTCTFFPRALNTNQKQTQVSDLHLGDKLELRSAWLKISLVNEAQEKMMGENCVRYKIRKYGI